MGGKIFSTDLIFGVVNLKRFVLILVLLCFLLCSCKDGKEKQFSGNGDAYKISAEGGWRMRSTPLNPRAEISVSDEKNSRYFIVLRDSKADFSDDVTMEKYTELSKKILEENGGDERTLEIVESGDGYYSCVCESDEVKIRFLVFLKEGKKDFYQIMFWTTESKFDDSKDDFLRIADSFFET